MKWNLITYPGSTNAASAVANLQLLGVSSFDKACYQSLKDMTTSILTEFMSVWYESQALAGLVDKGKLGAFAHVLLLRAKVTPRHRLIERAVTEKHIHSILSFLNSDCEWCVILEDDFQIKKDGVVKVKKFMQDVIKSNYHNPTYIDICGTGSLNIDELGLEQYDGICSQFKPHRSNTCCGYMINRKMAELIVAATLKLPSIKYLAIDWLLNVVFFKYKQLGFDDVLTLRSNHYFLMHGSFLGITKSWQKQDV
jgi:hypothetical protein